jgi:hypothetical protein
VAIDLDESGGSDRLRLRLHQLSLTTITVLITTWCVTLGTVAAILALVVAKHVLVAILIMGLDVGEEPEPEQSFSGG